MEYCETGTPAVLVYFTELPAPALSEFCGDIIAMERLGLKYKLILYPRILPIVCRYSRFVNPGHCIPCVYLMNAEA